MKSKVVVLSALLVLALLLPAVAAAEYITPQIIIHVYRDGSVVVEYSGKLNTTISSYTTGSVSGRITIGEKDFSFEMNAWSESPYEITPTKGIVALSINIVPEAGYLQNTIDVTYNISDMSNKMELVLSITGKIFPSNLTGRYTVSLHVTSTSPQVIDSVAQALANLNTAPGVIRAEGLSMTRSGNSIDARVNVEVYLPTLLRSMFIPTQIPVEKIAQLSYPVSLSFSFKVIDRRGELSVSSKIGTNVETILDYMTSTSVYSIISGLGFYPSQEAKSVLDIINATIKDFHKNFKLMPSTCEFTVNVVNGTADVSLKTPRFIARNATDVTSTIKALYWLVRNASNVRPELRSLMTSYVNITLADFTGTILAYGKQPAVLTFMDLPNVEIIPAGGQGSTGSTTTPQPSTQQAQPTVSLTEVSFPVIATVAVAAVAIVAAVVLLKRK